MALNIEHSETVKTVHRWRIPTNPPVGAVISDVLKAYSMAIERARELGINTSYDDWLRVHAMDDEIELSFETKGEK